MLNRISDVEQQYLKPFHCGQKSKYYIGIKRNIYLCANKTISVSNS